MITSSSNPRVRQILLLNSKARARRESGLFTAEGRKLYGEAPASWREGVFVSASYGEEHPDIVQEAGAEIVEDRIFARMCDTKTPQGILSLLRIPSYSREDLLRKKDPFLLVLEDLQDPGNVGTILRTAEAAGVDGIILSRNTVDLFAPKTVRATMGTIYRMPFLIEEDLVETVQWLKAKGIRSYAAHLKGQQSYSLADFGGGTAIFIGNEGRGLSDALSAAADQLLKIPMEGRVESLNAAVAAAILMYAVHDRRQ